MQAARFLLISAALMVAACGAAVSLDRGDGGASVGPDAAGSGLGGSSGSFGGSTTSSTSSSSGASGSSSTSSGGPVDAGPPDAVVYDASPGCESPTVSVTQDDAGACKSQLSTACGIVPYTVTCDCPRARCLCVIFDQPAAIVSYTCSATCDDTRLRDAYRRCAFPSLP